MNKYKSYTTTDIDWIDGLPSHWEVARPKYKLNRVTRPIDEDDDVITCFRDGVVTLRKNRREDGFTISIKEHGYQQVRPGDLVVHEMDGFAGAIGISDSKGKSTPVYTVVEPDNRTDLGFFNYLLREMSKTGKIESLARSIRERTTDFRWNMWSTIPFPFPPLEDQKLIARYLDKKTEQIDSLVEKVQKKMELLKEQRTSAINHYVTKGLNPNVGMKDSGVEWIGEIPKHWDISPMFTLFDENKMKNEQRRLDVLTLSYGKIKYRDLSKLEGLVPESFDGYQVMNVESVIIRSTDLQNDQKSLRVGHVGLEGVITSAYLGLNPKEQTPTKYYYYSIHLADLKKVLYGLGRGLRQSLRYDDFKRFPILNPPKREREEISKMLDSIDDKTNTLIDKLDRRITLLKEYRQSLISSAVTGKIRITEGMV